MRSIKRLGFGILFLIIISPIIWFIYGAYFQSAPTCFDNRKNGAETGIDCGGGCISCDIKNLSSIQASSDKIIKFDLSDGFGIVAEIYNPNSAWAVKSFDAQLNLKDSLGNIVNSYSYKNLFIYAGELKYIVEPYIKENKDKIVSGEVIISNPVWVSIDEQKKPDIVDQEVKTAKDSSIYVSGKIVNREGSSFQNINVIAILFNKSGEIITASKTLIDSVDKFSSREFKVNFSKDFELYEPITGIGDYLSKPLKKGDTGKDVKDLQELLKEFGILPIDKATTGFYDDETALGVSNLQIGLSLPSTGEYDEATVLAIRGILESNIPKVTKLQEQTSVDPTRTKVFIEVK